MLRLLAFQLRRDRLVLPIWIAATGLLAYASAAGVQAEFATDAARSDVLKLAVATPSLLALRGVPDGASLGSYVYFQVFCYIAIMAALMSTFFVTRHSRADEERGRLELIGATPIRRTAPLEATLVLGMLANLVLGILVALGFIGGGLEASGSWVAGLASAAVGVAFVGLAALVAQFAPTSRAANGISAALVGVAFLLRAAGDALGTPRADGLSVTSAWPSWLSPIGWGQQVFAFTQQNLLPLLLCLALAAVTAGAALAVQARRDVGSSILRERPGRATGPATLRSTLGLVWRQQWPSLIGWAIGGVLLGALAGTLATRIADAGDVAESLQSILAAFVPGGQGQLLDLLVVAIVGIGGVLAAGAGVQTIMRARSEEADGRAELVLAAPVGRVRWMLAYLLVAVISVLVVALATGLVTGLSFLGTGEPDRLGSSVAAGVAQVPAALTFVGLTAVIFALLPRWTIPAGWALFAVGFMVGEFGGLLGLPDWLRNISPFAHTPGIPGPDVNWTGAVVMLAIAVALSAVAALVMRRRELTS